MDKKVNTPRKRVAVWRVEARCYMELFNAWMAI